MAGFSVTADDTTVRPRFTRAEIAAFLPARGRFTFPPPYGTIGYRLTNADDGIIRPVGYAYWRNMNAHASEDRILIFLGTSAGPSLWALGKTTGVVERLGPLFSPDDPLYAETGEGWSFSASRPHALYVHRTTGTQLFRYDVLTRAREVVVDVASLGADRYLHQVHVSDDDRVCSMTIKQQGTYESLGCAVFREGQLTFFPKRGEYDECQIDKSGRWLVIKENVDAAEGEDNRIIDLQTGEERLLRDREGAVGHSDLGYGYLVGEDNFHSNPGAVRLWHLEDHSLIGELVYHLTSWTPGLGHVSHTNARRGNPRDQRVFISHAHREHLPRVNEIVAVPLDGSLRVQVLAPNLVDLDSGGRTDYDNLPKGNADVTGGYFLWTTNAGTDRLDAFIIDVGSALVPSGPPPSPSRPSPEGDRAMIASASTPILAFEAGDLISGNEAGTFAVRWPPESDTVLSVQPDGRYETRPLTSIGPWESAKKIGDKLVFRVEGRVYVIPIVEGL